jgi:hypothetical protein
VLGEAGQLGLDRPEDEAGAGGQGSVHLSDDTTGVLTAQGRARRVIGSIRAWTMELAGGEGFEPSIC